MFQAPVRKPPVVVAALGPQALALAGCLADGTTLAWVGSKTVNEHIKLRITHAAARADRPAPGIIATLPVCVTADEAAVRAVISRNLDMYGRLSSYQVMFEREGVAGHAALAIVDGRAAVTDSIAAVAEAGVTDIAASEFCLSRGDYEQTRETLMSAM